MAKQPLRHTHDKILGRAVPFFATVGFEGVSMRDVAAAVNLTPAALYHHFSNKEQLYLDAVGYAFREKVEPLKSLLDGGGTPWDRLEVFVAQFTRMLAKEKDVRRLMQWVLLDSNEPRLRKLADCVFLDLFNALRNLADEIAPGHDVHLLVVSMIGLVMYPFETQSVRRLLPGHRRKHEDPEAIARHVVGLLRNGLGGTSEQGHSNVSKPQSLPYGKLGKPRKRLPARRSRQSKIAVKK